jgi:RHS repeat-associated protein
LKKIVKKNKTYKFSGWIRLSISVLFICVSAKAFAVEEPYVNELKGTQVSVNNFFTVSDEKFNNLTPVQWGAINHVSTDDIVSFEINFDTSIYFYNQPFNCTANFKIYIYGNQADSSEITDSITHASINLNIRYDTATGKPYKGVALYKFKNAHKFKVKILSITCPQLNPIPAIFRVKGQIIVNRKYPFVNSSSDVTRFSVINGNQLQLAWTPSLYPGAEMFDLEYTYIDKNSQAAVSILNYSSGGNYNVPADSLAKWFKNNSSRITTAAASYLINLSYDSGFVLFRIRGVQIHHPDDLRWEGDWNYTARPVNLSCGGSVENCPSGVVQFNGHEQNLNWQFSISFAEEGKRKEVISYFDGSLRNRQSVTITNSDNKSVVQETVYDALGRPAASILPAPTDDSTIHYFRGFNKNKNGNPYSFSDLLYGSNCITVADSLSYLSGTGRYYSTNNPFQNTYLNAKYIPNAGGYPLAVTEYMADNTGRIKAQGGVGPTFQLGQNHETKYFYGKPTQTELDRLFGSEAGNASHYLKNMVQDANGQISVSYQDASGKTIATALAGPTPTNVHSLPSNNAGASVQVSNDLIQPGDFIRNPGDYSLSASATFLAPVTGNYVFNYRVDPLVYQKLFGPNKDSVICSNCYYDLEVTLKDDCENTIRSKTITAETIFDTACNPAPGPIQDSINTTLNKIGEYYVTYTLKVSKDALNFYDSVHLVKNSDIKKLNYFLLEELKQTDFYGCYSNCETCFDKLGTKPEFVATFKSLYAADSVAFGTADSLYALTLYDSLYANCQSIQSQCGQLNVCDEKLTMLKMDVSPGGQYALYDSAYNLLELPINRLAMRSQISFFTNDFGVRDSVVLYNVDGEDSVKVDVKQLNDSLFIKNWKNVWADSLVRLHPEYCYYLWCLANSNSYEFDKQVENLTDADSAKSRGWFDPAVYYKLLDADPFFSGVSNLIRHNKMKKALLQFSRRYVRNSQPNKNILQFIDIILYCKTQYNGWTSCNPDSACRSRNREWLMYKTLYLNLKQKFYEDARRTNPQFAACTNCNIGDDLLDGTGLGICTPPPKTDFSISLNGCTPPLFGSVIRINYKDGQTSFTENKYKIELRGHLIGGGSFLQTSTMPAQSSYICVNIGDLTVIDSIERIYCDTTIWQPFTDSLCNYSCSGGIYNPYDRDSVSYYVEYGNPNTPPTGTPPGYGNCQFYPAFELFTGPSSSCRFFNVWVCEYDSTITGGYCPPQSDFSTDQGPCAGGGGGSSLRVQVFYDNVAQPITSPVDVTVFYSYLYSTGAGGSSTFTVTFQPGGPVILFGPCVSCGSGCGVGITNSYVTNASCQGGGGGGDESYPSHCTATGSDTLYKNKQRRYPEYVNTDDLLNNLSSVNPQQGSGNQQQLIIDECKSNCEAQADYWIRVLSRCTTNPVKLAQLKTALINICSKGCSVNTPFGSSSIPSSIANTYHSFEEAIAAIIPGAINDSCTAELLAMPYPHDKQPVLTERIITETDYNICQRLGQYRTAYTSSGFAGSLHQFMQSKYGSAYTLDSADLYDLVNACINCNGILKNDVVLPPMFDPQGQPCRRCDSVQVSLTAFNTKFPSLPTSSTDYETLFANFFNHRLGFALTYDEYRAFLDSCTAHPGYTGQLCNAPVTEDVQGDDNSCIKELFVTALTNATNTYIAYIDSVRRDFREAWLTKCMNVQPKLNMTANLYEYHYTLYYYDQSGNLVKTVPPEGIKLLTPAELVQVQQKRMAGNNNYCNNNNAMLFGSTGATGTVSFQNSAETNTGNQPFTIEYWMKLSTFSNQGVFSNNYSFADGAGGFAERGYTVNIKNGRLVLLMGEGISATSGIVEVQSLPLSGIISLNTWNHFACERVGTGSEVKFYINGNEIPASYIKNNFVTGNIDPTPVGIYTGASYSNGVVQGLNNGSLKHLRIYKRAVPQTELRQNYFDYCGNPANSNALVFWETFNEGEWTTGPINGLMYVYDRVNNIPGYAGGSAQNFELFTGPLVPAHRLVTTYQYNSLNQVLQQYSPDGDTSVFFYDRLGRLTVSQNKEQKENASYSGTINRFSYTKYDPLGRIKEVGEKSGASDIRNVNLLDDATLTNWINNIGHSGVDKQITKTIYDNPINLYQSTTTSRKRVVASIYIENANDTEGDSTLYAYDILGNVKTLVQHVKALVAVDATNGKKQIDYEYDLVSGKVNMVSYQHGKGDQFYYKYSYDADNRVTRSYSSRDKLIWTEDASYTYYLHGPLARTELGQYKVQGVDYAYTLQGWLKGINSNALNPQYEMGQDGWFATSFARVSKDVYSYGLGYYNQDYTAIGGSGAAAMNQAVYQHPSGADNTGRQLFNGNISHTEVALSKIDNGAAKGYSYGYDQLNRLLFMNQHTVSGNTWNNSNIISAYAESIAYDANGNILQYQRKGANNAAGPLDMDSLNYKYNRDVNGNIVNNRLNHVRDAVGNSNYTVDIDNQSSNNYTYDNIGNLKTDAAESISNINWTVYGKIKSVSKTGTTITYGYDPGGNRTYKNVVPSIADDIKSTWYIRDAQGNTLAVYSKTGSAAIKWNEQHLYGSSRLGMWNWDTIVPATPPVVGSNGTPIYDSLLCGSRTYELSNHLGNVLVTVSDRKLGVDNNSDGVIDYYVADVVSATDNYVFGMTMPGRSYQSDKYRYGFNGKEKDKDISEGGQDYGMRIYDARIGRFLSVDPIAQEYPELTPYQFASNTPIQAIDLDGLEAATLTYQARVTAILVTGSVSLGVAVDVKGNFHLFYQWSAGIGVGLYGGAGLSAAFFPTASADNLMGSGFNAGGSLGLGGVSVSLDLSVSVSTDDATGKLNGAKLGVSGGGKLGPSLGAELHMDYSNSTSVLNGNLFSMPRSKLIAAIKEKVDDSWFLSMSDKEINNYVDYIAKTYKTLKDIDNVLNPPKPATKKKEQSNTEQGGVKKTPQSVNKAPAQKGKQTPKDNVQKKKENKTPAPEKKLKGF